MTTEGSFPLGGAVAVTITKGGQSTPLQRWLLLDGAWQDTTGLYTKGESFTPNQGILVMTSCNSVILFVMQRANWDFWAIKKFRNFFPFCQWVQWILIGDFVTLCDRFDLLGYAWGQAYIATGTIRYGQELWDQLTGWNWWAWSFQMGCALSGALMAQQKAMRMLHVGLVSLLLGLLVSLLEVLFQMSPWQSACSMLRSDRSPTNYDLGRDCAWHQYQLYSDLQCLDSYLPDDSNL